MHAAVGMDDLEGSGGRERSLLDDLPRDARDIAIVGVGGVELQGNVLGRVSRVDALIAEVAIDLEDALEPADQCALQEELGSDAQVEL